jgi:amino acid transporter
MAAVRELPELVREFVDMSKEYLRQETLDPAKELGRFAGISLGASAAFSLGALFLAVAGVRYIRDLLPDGPYWSALGYLIMAVVLAGVAGILVKLTSARIARQGNADGS